MLCFFLACLLLLLFSRIVIGGVGVVGRGSVSWIWFIVSDPGVHGLDWGWKLNLEVRPVCFRPDCWIDSVGVL